MTDAEAGFIVKHPSWDDEGWTRVPNEIVRDRVLTLEAKGLILYLASHSTSYRIDLTTLRINVGVGREKLRKLLRELETAGYLEREATFQLVDGRNRRGPNKYILGRSRVQQPDSQASDSEVPQIEAHGLTSVSAELPDSEAPGPEAPGDRASIKKTNLKKTSTTTLVVADASTPTPAKADPRGHRLPDDFVVTPEMVQWCRSEFPDLDGRRETEIFRDFWHSKAGASARKLDWVKTWKNWMRKAGADQQRQRRFTPKTRVYTGSSGVQIER